MSVFVIPAVLCLLLKLIVGRNIGAGRMTAVYCICIWASDPWPEFLIGILPAAILAYLMFAAFNSWVDQRRITSNKTATGRIARFPAPQKAS